jgi:uncharacterized protein YceH (UPF0502 family)
MLTSGESGTSQLKPMTAAQRAEIEARLDELMAEIRDLSQRLDAVTAVLPAVPA